MPLTEFTAILFIFTEELITRSGTIKGAPYDFGRYEYSLRYRHKLTLIRTEIYLENGFGHGNTHNSRLFVLILDAHPVEGVYFPLYEYTLPVRDLVGAYNLRNSHLFTMPLGYLIVSLYLPSPLQKTNSNRCCPFHLERVFFI